MPLLSSRQLLLLARNPCRIRFVFVKLYFCIFGSLSRSSGEVIAFKFKRTISNPVVQIAAKALLFRSSRDVKVKVKSSHTRHRALGPKLIPVYSLQVTVSHPPGGRLPLLYARPAVTSPAAEHHRPLAGTKLYCLVTEAHTCEQLA